MVYYFIVARALLLLKMFEKWKLGGEELIEYLMKEKGAEYTEKVFKGAVQQWRESK